MLLNQTLYGGPIDVILTCQYGLNISRRQSCQDPLSSLISSYGPTVMARTLRTDSMIPWGALEVAT
jgi:hypothetical protein